MVAFFKQFNDTRQRQTIYVV